MTKIDDKLADVIHKISRVNKKQEPKKWAKLKKLHDKLQELSLNIN